LDSVNIVEHGGLPWADLGLSQSIELIHYSSRSEIRLAP
jgi:hypothetical protein